MTTTMSGAGISTPVLTVGDKIVFPGASEQDASAIGEGQTWQDMTASRALATPYTNTTGRSIQASVTVTAASGTNLTLTVGGVVVGQQYAATGSFCTVSAIVPNGAVYSATVTAGTLSKWNELR